MQAYNEDDAVIQNLIDAGCGSDFIKSFLHDMACGNVSGQLQLLTKHRRALLQTIHKDQKQIDCLDYLIYQIEKQGQGTMCHD